MSFSLYMGFLVFSLVSMQGSVPSLNRTCCTPCPWVHFHYLPVLSAAVLQLYFLLRVTKNRSKHTGGGFNYKFKTMKSASVIRKLPSRHYETREIPSYKIPFLVTKVQNHSSKPLRVGIYFLWIINQKSKLAKAVSADWLYFNFQRGLFK